MSEEKERGGGGRQVCTISILTVLWKCSFSELSPSVEMVHSCVWVDLGT